MLVYRKYHLELPSTSILYGVYCAHHFNTVWTNKQTNKQTDNNRVLIIYINKLWIFPMVLFTKGINATINVSQGAILPAIGSQDSNCLSR